MKQKKKTAEITVIKPVKNRKFMIFQSDIDTVNRLREVDDWLKNAKSPTDKNPLRAGLHEGII